MKIFKKNMKRIKGGFVIQLGMLLAPAMALAEGNYQAPIKTVQGLVDLMCAVFGWMFYVLIALSLIMIVLAGFNYATAGDNPEKVTKASKMILYAVIGIAVALLAKGIPAIVANFIGADGTFTKC